MEEYSLEREAVCKTNNYLTMAVMNITKIQFPGEKNGIPKETLRIKQMVC